MAGLSGRVVTRIFSACMSEKSAWHLPLALWSCGLACALPGSWDTPGRQTGQVPGHLMFPCQLQQGGLVPDTEQVVLLLLSGCFYCSVKRSKIQKLAETVL